MGASERVPEARVRVPEGGRQREGTSRLVPEGGC